MASNKDALPGQAMLMLGVALDELKMIEAEPDIAKIRVGIASVQSTLRELLTLAHDAVDLDA